MKIYNKLNLFIIVLLVSILSIILSFNIYFIKASSTEQMEAFRKNEKHQIERQLINYLDMAYGVVDANYKNATDIVFLEKYYGRRLVNTIDSVESLIKFKMDEAESSRISIDQAKSEAMLQIRNIRFDNGTGYVFIINTDRPYPKTLMNPVNPALDGKPMSNPMFNTALGRGVNLGAAMVDVCLKNGEGFVDYVWNKPTHNGVISDVPKLSFSRMIAKWNWIIGTGIYIDDAVTDSMQKSMNDLKQMRYDNGTGYVFIINTDRPYPKTLMNPVNPALDGKPMSNPMFNTALGRGVNLGAAMVDVCLKNGEGFVDYAWNKPTDKGILYNVPKLSYAKLYEPLNWIIGTGVYIDDIDKMILENERMLKKGILNLTYTIIAFSVVLFGILSISLNFIFKKYFFRRNIDRINHQKEKEQEKPDDDKNELVKTTKEIGKVMMALSAILQAAKEDYRPATNSSEEKSNIS